MFGQNGGLWVLSLDGGRAQLSADSNAAYPLWTPDGQHVTFSILAQRDAQAPGVYRRVADGSREAEILREGAIAGSDWLPDNSHGTLLAYWSYPPPRDRGPIGGGRDIGVMSQDGDLSLLIATSCNERSPRFAPNGRWLAYVSDASGRDEVYVQGYPQPGSPR